MNNDSRLKSRYGTKNIFPAQEIMTLYMKQKCLITEKPKPKSHRKLNKWFMQANRSSEQHS